MNLTVCVYVCVCMLVGLFVCVCVRLYMTLYAHVHGCVS